MPGQASPVRRSLFQRMETDETTAGLWSALKGRIRNGRNRLHRSTRDHYSGFLPQRHGAVAGWMLGRFYSGIQIPEQQIEVVADLPEDAVVVYATKNKSRFEFLFCHNRFDRLGLPVPEWGFDYRILLWQPIGRLLRIFIAALDHLLSHRARRDPYGDGYIRRIISDGTAAALFLVEKEGFRRRFIKSRPDPLQHLIEIQKTMDRPIHIVPLLMYFGKMPHRSRPTVIDTLFGTIQEPGLLRRLAILFRRPEKVRLEMSAPFDLRGFLADPALTDQSTEQLATALRGRLLQQIHRHRQSVVGPALRSREELRERILTNDRIRGFIKEYAEKEGTPIREARKHADDYLQEIAAKLNYRILPLWAMIIRFFLNTMFEEVSLDTAGLARVRSMSQKAPTIFIPCHKSHIDYLILSYTLYQANMPCPLIAAGKNLSFWPLGPIFRSGGAFFLRRTFKGQPLYSRIFSEYIHRILEEGYNIEFFIEGGRSRTGKLILPKLGLLSIIINAFKNGVCDDLIIAPIYIGYDRVLEESAYLHELEGGQKRPENLKGVIRARKFLKTRYGRIYVKFHEPFSFRELIERMGPSLTSMSPTEQAAMVRNLGHRVIHAINTVSVVTPHAIVAAAFLNCTKRRIGHDRLKSYIDTYMQCLLAQGVTLADTLVLDAERALEQAIENYVQRKIVERFTLGPEESEENTVYTTVENRRPNLEYYKNNCVGFFVPTAFTALALLERDAFQFSTVDLNESFRFLQDLFKNEFAYDVDSSVESCIRKNIKAFIDEAILIPHPTLPDTYNLTSAGFRLLRRYAAFLTPYFQSYWIVLTHFRKSEKTDLPIKERLKKIESLGNRMYKNEEIERKEALSKVYYKNAAEYFISRGVTGDNGRETAEVYADRIQAFFNVLP
jgi:glycerol-3-phosphate O-acyltransferase